MRKDILLPALALAGGGVGFALRLWQRLSALDPATQLYDAGAPASLALAGWFVLVALLALLLGRGGRLMEPPAQSFLCPLTGYMTVMAASCFCFLGTAALAVPVLCTRYQAWKLDSSYNLMPAALALVIVGCLAGGLGTIVSGRNNYRRVVGPRVVLPAVLPAYAALPWLMELYQTYSRDPVVVRVYVPLLAAVFLLLSLHHQAAFYFRRVHPFRGTVFAVLGITFGMASLADGAGLLRTAGTCAFLLCNLGGLIALSHTRFSPNPPEPVPEPKPAPGKEGEQTAEPKDGEPQAPTPNVNPN